MVAVFASGRMRGPWDVKPCRRSTHLLAVVLFLALASTAHAKKKKLKPLQQPLHQDQTTYGRVKAHVGDAAVQKAAQFAISELQGICEYCDPDTKAAYEVMELSEVHSAETKQLTVMEGTMFILNATLKTSIPVFERTEDNQVIVVFQKPDGSYTGISTERSPFLNH
eukprot:CAMPEP_0117649364 /NCGR_PEP_ID=MMETSP0804-20121206/930_1 /TAXON_ID=1074897 /ORGANISM="Tetraselmis astigmatica, Strain CCMP880" /LENGTH=166 /DNA_ID=CAMNT_0005455091 /DNA_START=17 /DNA_END=517 /DNA_ORIENTATION=+